MGKLSEWLTLYSLEHCWQFTCNYGMCLPLWGKHLLLYQCPYLNLIWPIWENRWHLSMKYWNAFQCYTALTWFNRLVCWVYIKCPCFSIKLSKYLTMYLSESRENKEWPALIVRQQVISSIFYWLILKWTTRVHWFPDTMRYSAVRLAQYMTWKSKRSEYSTSWLYLPASFLTIIAFSILYWALHPIHSGPTVMSVCGTWMWGLDDNLLKTLRDGTRLAILNQLILHIDWNE